MAMNQQQRERDYQQQQQQQHQVGMGMAATVVSSLPGVGTSGLGAAGSGGGAMGGSALQQASVTSDTQPLFSFRRLDWPVMGSGSSGSGSGKRRGSGILAASSASLNTRRGATPFRIHKVCVCNNVICVATSGSTVVRWSLQDGGAAEPEEIELPGDDPPQAIFLDPTGTHLFAVVGTDVYYVRAHSHRPKKLSKLQPGQGATITAMAFDWSAGPDSVLRSFVAGTSDGRLFEGSIEASGKDKYFHQLHRLDHAIAIADLHYEPVVEDAILVMATTCTPTRIYTFVGGPSLEALFKEYSNRGTTTFSELPGAVDRTEFKCFSKDTRSRHFAVKTHIGIYHGTLLLSASSLAQSHAIENIIAEATLTNYPESHPDAPVTFGISEFHFILVWHRRVQIMNRLDGRIVQELNLAPEHGRPVALVRDHHGEKMWLFAEYQVFQVTVHAEDQNIWSIYLDRALHENERYFDTAFSYCHTAEQRAAVHDARASDLLKRGEYDQAAMYYAKTETPFEEVALKFMADDDTAMAALGLMAAPAAAEAAAAAAAAAAARMGATGSHALPRRKAVALRTYLQEKLKHLPQSDKSQRTMLCTWLTEMFMAELADEATDPTSLGAGTGTAESKRPSGGVEEDANGASLSAVRQRFQRFVDENLAYMNPNTTIAILSSHDRPEEILYFAKAIEQYERAVAHYINTGNFVAALEVLDAAPWQRSEELFYVYAPALIVEEPEQAVRVFLRHSRLDATRLVPALLKYAQRLQVEKREAAAAAAAAEATAAATGAAAPPPPPPSSSTSVNWAMRYLEAVIHEQRERTPCLHYLLLSFYAEDGLEDKVVELLSTGTMRRIVDLKLVLRICKAHQLDRASAMIYSMLGMHEEAVRLSLDIDVELAKEHANNARDNSRRRALWLLIARHISEHTTDVKSVLQVLEDSQRLVKIEDVLALFPSVTRIDDFKEDIVRTLEEYNNKVEVLRSEMGEYSESAESIVREIETMQQQGFSMASNQACPVCEQPVLSRQFYLFPCCHAFHADCLYDFVCPFLDKMEQRAVTDLRQKILQSTRLHRSDGDKRSLQDLEYAQLELDGYVAGECPLCGVVMVRAVSVPLVQPHEDAEARAWEI